MKPQRVSIIGGRGFIGGHLSRYLSHCGHQCHVFGPEVADYSGPLGRVFYCAGVTSDFRQRPTDTVESHARLLSDILQRHQFESLLYCSSTRLYQHGTSSNEDSTIVTQPSQLGEFYNLSKLLGESLCLEQAQAQADGAIKVVRLSNIFGPGMDERDLLGYLALCWRQQQVARVGVSLQTGKDYLSINDVVPMLWRIALEGRSDCYNLASGQNHTLLELQHLLTQLDAEPLRLVSDSDRDGSFIPIDTGRVQREFQFRPTPMLPSLRQWLLD